MVSKKREDSLIIRQEDGWTVVYIGGKKVLYYQAPPDVTREEMELFIEHLKKIARERQHGPN